MLITNMVNIKKKKKLFYRLIHDLQKYIGLVQIGDVIAINL